MTAKNKILLIRRQAGLTKKQISQIKFRPGGIQKNGIQCRVTENAVCGDVIRICLETRGTDSAQLKTPKFLQIQAEETKKRNDTSDGYADFGVECRGKNESISDLRSDSKKECSEGKNAVSNFKCGFPDLEILYEDQDVLAVNKPVGMVTHPSGIHYQDSLSNQIAEYFRSKGEETRIRSIGRLDKETSGILLFARNQISAARLQKQREEGKLQKTYLAVVEGTFEEEISQSSYAGNVRKHEKKRKKKEEQYINSPLNNPMLNYDVYIPGKRRADRRESPVFSDRRMRGDGLLWESVYERWHGDHGNIHFKCDLFRGCRCICSSFCISGIYKKLFRKNGKIN